MNWYKTAQEGYTDVGHYFWGNKELPPDIKEFVWLINGDWELDYFESDADSTYDQTHRDKWGWETMENGIARGRAIIGPKYRMSSAIMEGIPITRLAFYKGKIAKILEREFGVNDVRYF